MYQQSKKGKKDGRGVLKHPLIGEYEGEWKNDTKDGKGVLTTSDNSVVYDGYWKNGIPEGQ